MAQRPQPQSSSRAVTPPPKPQRAAAKPQVSRKLGKRPAIIDPRVPRLHDLTMAQKLVTPPSSDWYSKISAWPMLDNDQIGNCVIAYVLHCVQQRDTYAGNAPDFSNNDAISLYSAWSGYVPGDPSTDQGMVMSDALADWATYGVPMPGGGAADQVNAYASVDHMSQAWLKFAIWRCGGVGMGLQCPTAWIEDVPPGGLLDINGYPSPDEIAGGHCVFLAGYETQPNGTILFNVVTWGDLYPMTWRAARMLADEAYAILDLDWMDAQGFDPAGLDLAQAQVAIDALRAPV